MYTIGEEEIEAVARVVRSGDMFRYGEGGQCDLFEKRYAEFVGIEHAAQDLFRQGIVAVVAVPPRYKLAQEKFQAAVDSDPKFMEAYFNLGMTLERQGKSEEALDVYKDALDASPDDVSAQAYIAKIYLGKARRAALLACPPERSRTTVRLFF